MEFFETFHSVWTIVTDNIPYLVDGMLLTLQITLTAIFVGILWGTVLAVMRLSNNALLSWFSAIYVNTFRSIPLVMVLFWFYLLVPQFIESYFNLAPTTDVRLVSAMVAFALFEAAYYSEIIRAGFMSVSKGQTSAALALGMTPWQSLFLIVMPQAFRTMTPLLLTQAIILFQDASLVYAIGLTDFFRSSYLLGEGSSSGDFKGMIFFAGAVYFIICFSASSLVNFLKKRTAQ
mgnify:FL=1